MALLNCSKALHIGTLQVLTDRNKCCTKACDALSLVNSYP